MVAHGYHMNTTTITTASLAALFATAPSLAQVAGDECSNAVPAIPGLNTINTEALSASANPPANDGCNFLNWGLSRDGWFRFDATGAGSLALDFCASSYDTSVVVYRGSCGSLERVACDDDSCNPTGPGYQSRVAVAVTEAGPIFVRVGGYAGAFGTAVMNLSFTESAPTEGLVRAWGQPGRAQSTVPSGIGLCKQVVAGHSFNLAITSGVGGSGTANLCLWGDHGVPALDTIPLGLADGASKVAAGWDHALAIRASDGAVFAWGSSSSGQCNVPADLGPCIDIAGGMTGSLAVTAAGTVRGWGFSQIASAIPSGLGACTTVAAGSEHGVAIRTDGTVACWGANEAGQATVPSGLGACTAIAAGSAHTVALLAGGSVACWGSNSGGQCTVPADLGPVTSVTAFFNHTGAVTATRSARMWGLNANGQTSVPADLGQAIALATGFAHSVAIALPDCNGNGVPDASELSGHDCNGNARLDACDATEDLLEDCNGNGYGDQCEKQATVEIFSPRFEPIGRGTPANLRIANAVPAVAPVTLRVRARGDFGSPLEYVRVRIGSAVDMRMLAASDECATFPVFHEVMIDPEEFNLGIEATGTLHISVEPSDAVDALGCAGGTWLDFRLAYIGATSADCNSNGALDSCEITGGWEVDANGNGIIDLCEAGFTPCAADFDGNGIVNGADLGALLGSWGPVTPGIPVDLSGDGMVNGADLGILLGAWGPCAS